MRAISLQSLSILAISCTAAVGSDITLIGSPTGVVQTAALAVSDNGQWVAGWYRPIGQGQPTAIRWSEAGGIEPLGTLWSANLGFSEARGISADGSVIVGQSDSLINDNVVPVAFRWTLATGIQRVPGFPFTTRTEAMGVSNNGLAIAGSSIFFAEPTDRYTGFRFANGSFESLGSLIFPLTSRALAISRDGATLVGQSGSLAFRWTSAGGMQSLGLLAGQNSAVAHAVNADGSIVVGGSDGSESGSAFRWTAPTGIQPLPMLPGSQREVAFAVNGDGSIIGGESFFLQSGSRAVVWKNGQVYDLRELFVDQGINMQSWLLDRVFDLSADGRTAVGIGRFNGQPRGWIITSLCIDDCPPACDSIDFNNNGVFPEDQDVIDFLEVLAGGTPSSCDPSLDCNDIDFNNNDVFPEDQDVIDFFNVLAGGACP